MRIYTYADRHEARRLIGGRVTVTDSYGRACTGIGCFTATLRGISDDRDAPFIAGGRGWQFIREAGDGQKG